MVTSSSNPSRPPDDRLTHYKCPTEVSFAATSARIASGKIQKQAIRSSLGSLPAP
jgi:hypothetical protein